MRADEAALASRLIDDALLSMVFQPIVDLRSGKIFGYEALSRPQLAEFKSPPELARAALSAGRVGELGRLQRRLAVKSCTTHPLFLNIDPNEFDQPWLVRADDPVFSHKWPVYLEITEAVPLHYFEQCHSVLAELRSKGALLAIDDLGAGFSNLKYIVDLKPDIVKLDRNLVSGAQPGSRQFQLLRSIAELCHEMNAKVVAEGIEEVEELQTAALAGVDFCQGYLLARPAAPPPSMFWPRDARGRALDAQGLARYCEEYHRLTGVDAEEAPPDLPEVAPDGDADQRLEALESALKWARAEARKAEARVETAEAASHRLRNQVTALRDALAESERARQQLVAQVRKRSSGLTGTQPGNEAGRMGGVGVLGALERRLTNLASRLAAPLRSRGRGGRAPARRGGGNLLSTLRLGAIAAAVTAGVLLLLVPVYDFLTSGRAVGPGGESRSPITMESPPLVEPETLQPQVAESKVTELEVAESGEEDGGTAIGPTADPGPLPAGTGAEDRQADLASPGVVEPEVALAAQETRPRAAPEPRQEQVAQDRSATTRTEAEGRVRAWAQAWSDRRVEDYLSFYAEGFLPVGGANRQQWEAERRLRLPAPEWIRVTLDELQIEIESAARARARFWQLYESDRYSDTVRKTLELVVEGGEWKILRETSEQI